MVNRDNIIDRLTDVETSLDRIHRDLEKYIEPTVAGNNALSYRAALRLIESANSAAEEARGWLQDWTE